jgi:restriction system protein
LSSSRSGAGAADAVIGQIQRYMGFVREALLEPGQSVEGVIIAQEDDLRIRRTLFKARNIRFMKYRVEFHLESVAG